MKYFKDYEQFNEGFFSNNSDIKLWSRGEDIKKLQTALEVLGFKLPKYGIDSIFGWETLSRTKSLLYFIEKSDELLKLWGKVSLELKNNSITKEQLEAIISLSNNKEAINAIKNNYKKLLDVDNDVLLGQVYIDRYIKNPEEFVLKLKEICKRLEINVNWLLLVIYKESRMNPKAINKKTGASGLIQFMPKTAISLGTTVEDIRKMTGIQQLDYIEKYYKHFTGKIHNVEDLYMVTFYPKALYRKDTANIGGPLIAQQNPAIDLNKDGQIKVGEFRTYVKKDTATLTQNLSNAA